MRLQYTPTMTINLRPERRGATLRDFREGAADLRAFQDECCAAHGHDAECIHQAARRHALHESFRRVRVDREIDRCMRESARVLGPRAGSLPNATKAFRAIDEATRTFIRLLPKEDAALVFFKPDRTWPTYG